MIETVLVVGFSVTAEHDGFIHHARRHPDLPRNVALESIAIGGIHAVQLKYIFSQILEGHAPSAVILEISTSTFREWTGAAGNYLEAIKWMLNVLAAKGIAAGFFDIPRRDVVPETDWAFGMTREICAAQGLAYGQPDLDLGLLRDIVHPTPEGKAKYGEDFVALVRRLLSDPVVPRPYDLDRSFGAAHLSEIWEDPLDLTSFERANFSTTVANIPQDATARVTIPDGVTAVGLSFLMHPLAGDIIIADDTAERRLPTYDRHCYYTRFGMRNFAPLPGRSLRLYQVPEVPDAELLKGDKDFGPRIGYVGHVLLEGPPGRLA